MSPGIIALIVVVIIAVAVVGIAFARPQLERQRLRMRFGEEYDHAVRAHGNHGEAERDLLAREERHRKLNLRPLDPEARDRYRAEWTAIQERFVDDPRAAAGEAEGLIAAIMNEQGYPDEGHDQRLADLSVGRTRAVGHFRRARDVSSRAAADGASTEDLRQALMHYRTVLDDLLDGRSAGRPAGRSGGLLGGRRLRALGRDDARTDTESVGGR